MQAMCQEHCHRCRLQSHPPRLPPLCEWSPQLMRVRECLLPWLYACGPKTDIFQIHKRYLPWVSAIHAYRRAYHRELTRIQRRLASAELPILETRCGLSLLLARFCTPKVTIFAATSAKHPGPEIPS